MARFKETVDIRQAPGIQTFDDSLSARLDNFAQQQLSKQAQKVTTQSFASGQAALEEGKAPEFKEEKFFGSIGAKAYNEGLRASYVASIDRDNREEVSRLAAENPTNLAAFNDSVESYKNATLTNIDPTARQVISDSIESLISSNRIKVQTAEIKATHEANNLETADHVQSAVDDALGFARDGNDIGAAESALAGFAGIDGRVAAGFISAEQGAIEKREIEKDLTQEKLKGGLFRTFDDQGAQASLEELDDLSDKVPGGFAPNEWDDFIAGTQTDLNRKINRQKQIAKEGLKAESLESSVKRGFLFTNPNIPADPAKSSQDRKDVNNYYDQVSPSWQGNTNDLINNNVEFVKNTGLVPDQLISTMNSSMRSGNTENVTAMMETMQRIQEQSPNSIKDFPDESRAISIQVSDAMRNGLDAEQAVEAARENTYGLTSTQKEEIKIASAGKEGTKRLKNFEEMVSNEFDPFQVPLIGLLRNEPDIPPGMQASYMSNLNNFMAITGANVEQSEKLAFESLKNVWAVSETGGPRRFMRNAPEGFYHVEGFDDSWIEDQFLEDAATLEIPDAIIGSDEQTARSDKPSYPILAPNKDGILDTVEDAAGRPMRFQPDIKETQQFKDLVMEPGKRFEKAKAKRERELGQRANSIARNVQARIFAYTPGQAQIPRGERVAFLESEEGLAQSREAVNNMLAIGKIDVLEAKETLEALGAGDLSDLPSFDILVKSGKINADNQ